MPTIRRKLDGTPHGRRLPNGSGVGLVALDPQDVPVADPRGEARWPGRQLLTARGAVML